MHTTWLLKLHKLHYVGTAVIVLLFRNGPIFWVTRGEREREREIPGLIVSEQRLQLWAPQFTTDSNGSANHREMVLCTILVVCRHQTQVVSVDYRRERCRAAPQVFSSKVVSCRYPGGTERQGRNVFAAEGSVCWVPVDKRWIRMWHQRSNELVAEPRGIATRSGKLRREFWRKFPSPMAPVEAGALNPLPYGHTNSAPGVPSARRAMPLTKAVWRHSPAAPPSCLWLLWWWLWAGGRGLKQRRRTADEPFPASSVCMYQVALTRPATSIRTLRQDHTPGPTDWQFGRRCSLPETQVLKADLWRNSSRCWPQPKRWQRSP